MTSITTVSQLYGWNGEGTATLMNDLTIANADISGNFPVSIGKSDATTLFKGQKYTITLAADVSNWPGLFTPVSGAQQITIENFIIKYTSGATLKLYAGTFIAHVNSNIGFTLTINDCAATGTFSISNDDCGGIMGMSNYPLIMLQPL